MFATLRSGRLEAQALKLLPHLPLRKMLLSAGLLQILIKMRIKVKVKDIEIEVDDNDNNAVIKYESHNNQVLKTIKVMCEEAMKLLNER